MFAASSDALRRESSLLDGAPTPASAGDYENPPAPRRKRGHTEAARLLGVGSSSPAENAEVKVVPVGVRDRSIPGAVRNSLALLEKQSDTFIRTAGCNSCHSQSLPSAVVGLARDNGLTSMKRFRNYWRR
jgi:hypothetical protein